MSRYIDADALKDYFVDLSKEKDIGFGDVGRMIAVKIEHIIDTIENAPTIEPKRGEWLKFGLGRGTRILFCTNCERRIEVPLSQGDSNYDFCPNCGADMREVRDE